jgi:hypothetical protein
MGAGMGSSALWVIIWLLILIFISFEVAGFCSFFYIFILPFTVCIPDLSVRGQIANYYFLLPSAFPFFTSIYQLSPSLFFKAPQFSLNVGNHNLI